MSIKVVYDLIKTGISVGDTVTITVKGVTKNFTISIIEETKITTAQGASGYSTVHLEPV